MGLDWNWSLGSGSGGGGNVVQSDTSGAAILAALLGGGSNNNASTQSVDGTADNNVTDGGGSTTFQNGSNSSNTSSGTTNQSMTDALRTGIQNGNNDNSDIWMGGSNGQTELPGEGLWNKFSQWANTYANTGLAPNFSGNAPIFKGGGGGGGGGGGASANGQKAVFDARTKTWSLYDPTSKKWTDGIGQNDIYSQLTGTLKDESPEWWWGDTARSAVNQEEYQNLRYANQYQSTQQGNRQQTRYSTYGL
jgi:hypothetical protein